MRVARALDLVGLPYLHVSQVPGFEAPAPGQSNRDDETIAKWCAASGRVLVTQDHDFRARTVRTAALARYGAEVIVFARPVAGPVGQLREILARHDGWLRTLAEHPPGGRVWLQGRSGPPALDKPRTR